MLPAGASDRTAEGPDSRDLEELVGGQCGCGSRSEISVGSPCPRRMCLCLVSFCRDADIDESLRGDLFGEV